MWILINFVLINKKKELEGQREKIKLFFSNFYKNSIKKMNGIAFI